MLATFSFTLLGAVILPALAAPMNNGNPASQHPTGKVPDGQVQFGNVYGVKTKDYNTGPPNHAPIPPPGPIVNNAKGRKDAQQNANRIHPYIPTDRHGDHYSGFVVTHNPPPGQYHVDAQHYGQFPHNAKGEESRMLTDPKHVHKDEIWHRPQNAPEKLHPEGFGDLREDWCRRGLGGACSMRPKGSKTKISAASKKAGSPISRLATKKVNSQKSRVTAKKFNARPSQRKPALRKTTGAKVKKTKVSKKLGSSAIRGKKVVGGKKNFGSPRRAAPKMKKIIAPKGHAKKAIRK